MKRTRDRSNRVRPAPAPNVNFGGTAVSGGPNQSPTVGQAGAGNGARRPASNTMAKSRDGGMPITYYAPMERWQATTARTAGNAPPRIPGRRFDEASHEKVLAAAESAGLRERAMARHSILTTTGAVDVRPRIGPIWSDDSE